MMMFPQPAESPEHERLLRKQKLAAAFRLFAKLGFDEGVAGHITARDPIRPDHFWVNPFGVHFGDIRVADLVLVNHDGDVVEGSRAINVAAFAIHSQVHKARPDVIAAAHAHSIFGRTWSALGRHLEPINQDACAFYQDHGIFPHFSGVVTDIEEGRRIGEALGPHKAVILQNHGLLTVGDTVDAAIWWFISMERCCQSQLLAEAAGKPTRIDGANAEKTHMIVGSPLAGWFSFQPLHARIVKEQPDLLEASR
ncbi:MAG: Decarboxylase NovR [Myxococcota bacterium]|nr:Decarboxylase NovR [Myxococcota bacterium]